MVVQDQLSEVKSQVDILASKQVQFEKSKEREKRCNIIIGNFQTPDVLNQFQIYLCLFKYCPKKHYTPTQSLRIGKKKEGKIDWFW